MPTNKDFKHVVRDRTKKTGESYIAEYVHTKYKVADWWTQTVTVGYERIKGLRARGQPDAARMKTFWSEKLQALAELLAPAEKASR